MAFVPASKPRETGLKTLQTSASPRSNSLKRLGFPGRSQLCTPLSTLPAFRDISILRLNLTNCLLPKGNVVFLTLLRAEIFNAPRAARETARGVILLKPVSCQAQLLTHGLPMRPICLFQRHPPGSPRTWPHTRLSDRRMAPALSTGASLHQGSGAALDPADGARLLRARVC